MFFLGLSQTVYDSDGASTSSSSASDDDFSAFGGSSSSDDAELLSLIGLFRENYCDDNEDIYLTGDAYLTPNRSLSLEKMASVRIAIELLNHAIDSLPELRPDKAEWRKSLLEHLKSKCTPQLPLPKSFVGYIEDHLHDIVLNIKDWSTYHLSKIMWSPATKNDLLRCLPCIVWHANGSINFYETALNLLNSDKLGDVEKYRLACTYCLKEEVKKRWLALDGHKDLGYVAGSFYEHPLYYYWNYYYIDNLDKIPKDEDISLDCFMIRQTGVDNWPAIEYFFDRMNADEQTSSAVYLIERDDFEYQYLLLAKLNESQRLRLYTENGVRIIENYARFGGADINDPNAISAWYEVRDLIGPDEFAVLMKTLCIDSAADAVMTEIWTSAYDEFKRHILTSYHYNFIGDVLRWCCCKIENGYDFLLVVLAEETEPLKAPDFIRKKIIDEVCEKLTLDGKLELANRLLNLCIPDAEECAKLKEYWLKRSRPRIFIN